AHPAGDRQGVSIRAGKGSARISREGSSQGEGRCPDARRTVAGINYGSRPTLPEFAGFSSPALTVRSNSENLSPRGLIFSNPPSAGPESTGPRRKQRLPKVVRLLLPGHMRAGGGHIVVRVLLDRIYLFSGYLAGLFLIAIFVLMMLLSAGRPLGINIPAGDDFISWCMAATAF